VAVAMVLPPTQDAVRVCAAMKHDIEVPSSPSASCYPTSPHRRVSYASGGQADYGLAS